MIETVVGDFSVVRAVEIQSDHLFRKDVYPNIQLWRDGYSLALFVHRHLAYRLRGLWLITGGIESPRDVAVNAQRRKRADTGKYKFASLSKRRNGVSGISC
jgi:hypothetical protein